MSITVFVYNYDRYDTCGLYVTTRLIQYFSFSYLQLLETFDDAAFLVLSGKRISTKTMVGTVHRCFTHFEITEFCHDGTKFLFGFVVASMLLQE